MKYKLAIFDFDGTLANTLPWFFSGVNRMADIHGFMLAMGVPCARSACTAS